MYAALKGDVARVRFLIARGARLEAAMSSGPTALYLAVSEGHVDALRALLDAGASVEGSWAPLPRNARGRVPETTGPVFFLSVAASASDDRAFSVESQQPPPRFWCSPLYWAAECNRVSVVELLLERGARHDVPTDTHDNRPLYIAAKKGHADVVRLLLKAGADPSAKRAMNSESPLYAALRAARTGVSHVEVVRHLLAFGADPVRPLSLLSMISSSFPQGLHS
jgi:ankyrin repeat protein